MRHPFPPLSLQMPDGALKIKGHTLRKSEISKKQSADLKLEQLR
jgi:hypothetical protein